MLGATFAFYFSYWKFAAMCVYYVTFDLPISGLRTAQIPDFLGISWGLQFVNTRLDISLEFE